MFRFFALGVLGLGMASVAGAVPVQRFQRFETGPACNQEQTGHLEMALDVFGSYGSATGIDIDARFNPANDEPDRGPRGTVFESMPFLCATQAGASRGAWLEEERIGDVEAVADGEGNRLTSRFELDGIDVQMEATFECNILTQCYTFTNNTAARLDEVALIHYVDGDLFFVGNFNNDFGATSVGVPKTIWEFDAGDNPREPTTQLSLYGVDPDDAYLTGWEHGEYSESRRRIGTTRNGCEPLRNGITVRNGANSDLNGDLVTDNGYDVTLSLRFDTGPLEPDEMSPAICYQTKWGFALACSDEDEDGVCVPEDNCPQHPNGGQADNDRDGIGNVCDNCPEARNPDQADEDGDGRGDACSMCDPVDEICNGLDDDCDGTVDEQADGTGEDCETERVGACREGTVLCVGGGLECAPTTEPINEVCDGEDNDCDGSTDEDVSGAGIACDTGRPGVCAEGLTVCLAEVGQVRCEPETPDSPEVCDALDNDCDGAVDEQVAGLGEVCVTGEVGGCAFGQTACGEGELECAPDEAVEPEVCDGADNDCDGTIDEGQLNACGRCGGEPTEQCNGLDDDCDGDVDEEAECPTGVCFNGRCVDECVNFECTGILVCIGDACVHRCERDPCDDGLTCDFATGLCRDLCEDVDCPGGELCVEGDCVPDDCRAHGCADGEVCVGGECQEDPCVGVECVEGEFCRDGECAKSCAQTACAGDEICVDGACVGDPCRRVECDGELECVEGECVDPGACAGVRCGPDEVCEGGECVGDPCAGVRCPVGEECVVRQGAAQCVREGSEPPPPDFDGGPSPGDAGPDSGGAVLIDGGVQPPDGGGGGGDASKIVPAGSSCSCDSSRGLAPGLLLMLLGLGRRRDRGAEGFTRGRG